MKKLISLLLVLTLAMSLVACGTAGSGDTTPSTTESTTESTGMIEDNVSGTQDTVVTPEPNEATKVFTAIWNAVAEDKKFFAMGGDMNSMVDNAPGNYSLEDEGVTTVLYVPAEQIQNLAEISSLMHGMMANHFTGGVFRLTEGADATAFADAMKASIENAQWICGTPEKMLITVIDGEYVLAAFGLNDNIAAFEAALDIAYADAEVKYAEAITG